MNLNDTVYVLWKTWVADFGRREAIRHHLVGVHFGEGPGPAAYAVRPVRDNRWIGDAYIVPAAAVTKSPEQVLAEVAGRRGPFFVGSAPRCVWMDGFVTARAAAEEALRASSRNGFFFGVYEEAPGQDPRRVYLCSQCEGHGLPPSDPARTCEACGGR